MEISGSQEFPVPPEGVWNILMDPDILANWLPGVESFDPVTGAEYAAVVSLGVGPVRGRYNAKIFLLDHNPNESYRLMIEGSDSIGFADGEAQITLVEQEGSTTVHV